MNPIVLIDPRAVAEELRAAFREAISPEEIAQTLKAMLSATKIVSTRDGAEHQPDWTARERAIRIWAETLIGKPRQEVHYTLERNEADGEAELLAKLRNPAYARALMAEIARSLPPEEAGKLAGEVQALMLGRKES